MTEEIIWYDYDTAPRDGTPFIVFDGTDHEWIDPETNKPVSGRGERFMCFYRGDWFDWDQGPTQAADYVYLKKWRPLGRAEALRKR